jgi:hypothetical protein
MSEKYGNLRRGKDLEDPNQRRFEQEVAEEIGIGKEREPGGKAGETGRTPIPTTETHTERKTGKEGERGTTPAPGRERRDQPC